MNSLRVLIETWQDVSREIEMIGVRMNTQNVYKKKSKTQYTTNNEQYEIEIHEFVFAEHHTNKYSIYWIMHT